MSKKKVIYILDLCENSETRYKWKHIWKTQGVRIESDLQEKGISFMEDSQSTDPVAILDTPPIDTARLLIRRVFNEKTLCIKAKCYAIESGVTPQEADKVSIQLSTDDVGIYKGNKNEWWIVGSVEKIDNVIKSFHHAIDSVLKDKCNINQTDKTVDDTYVELPEPVNVQMREEEKAIMWIHNLLQIECLQQSSVDMRYNRFDFKISVPDMSTKVTIEKQLRGRFDSYKNKIASKVLSFSPPVYKFILQDCVHEFVKSKMVFLGKPDCVWFKGVHNTLTVYAENSGTLERKCKIIKDSIKEDSVAVPPRYFKTEEALQKLSELEKKQPGKLSLELSTSCSTVNILCTSDVTSSKANVQHLFSERTLSVSRQRESICKLFFRKCKAVLEEQLAVDISEASDNFSYKWTISGEAVKVKVASEELNKLQCSVSSETKTYISDENLDTIRSKVKTISDNSSCIANILFDMEVSKTKFSSKNITDLRLTTPCRSLQMADGHHITVYKCSLKQNPWLMKDCLVVNVLSVSEKTSSAEFNIRKDNENNCYQGLLYLPDWKENVNKEKDALDKVLNDVMDVAKSCGKMSLAFDMVEVNKLRWPGNKYLKGILYSIQTNKPAIDVHIHEYSEVKYEKASKMICDWCTAETEKIKPNLKITVVKGELAKQKSDILVNSTNGTLNLKQGIVSSSLLRAAGEELQKECSRYLSSKGNVAISYTEVVITSGYGLSCKRVFHGTLPCCGYDTNQNFEQFIQNCLRNAVALNFESITFPALGTGKLGYPPEVSAKMMFDVVEQFASSSKTGILSDVRFVIYHGDEKSVKAFEYEETKRNEKGLVWNEAKVANHDCLPFNVSVVGENTNSIQQTFKQIYDILKKKDNTKDEALAQAYGGVTSEQESFVKEPAEQKMIREETNKSGDNSTSKQKREMVDKSSNDIQGPDNTFAPPDTYDRQMTSPPSPKPEDCSGSCHVDVEMLQQDRNMTPCEMLTLMLKKYGVTEGQIVWCPRTPLKARLKFQIQTDASDIIDKMKDDKRFKLQKSSLDAVVNIRAKLNNAFSKTLQDKNVRALLRKQSGVNIFDEGGDSIILTGDLTEIGAAREILRAWNIEQYENILDDTSTTNTLDHLTKTGNKYEKGGVSNQFSETIVSDTSKIQKRTVHETNGKLQTSVDTKEDTIYTRNDTDSSFSKNCATSYKSETGKPEWKNRQNSDNSNVDPREKGIYPNIQGMIGDINQTNSNTKGQGATPKQYTFQKSKPDTTDNTDPKHQNVNRSENSSTDDKYAFPRNIPYVGDVPKENIYPDLKGDTKSFAKDTKVNVKTTHSKFVEPNDEFVMMMTKEGIKVYVYKADMCYLRVNSIVNSTNSYMTNKFGLSKAISKNAGQTMEHQCQEYLSKYHVLEKDKVCRTHAGKLTHYNCILHVNAPKWDDNTNDKHFAGDLSKAIQICLTEANRIGVHSIALPAISSGYGAAPEKITFKAYPKGVLKFCEENAKTLVIKEIHFVDIDQNVVDHVQAAFLGAIPEPSSNFIDKLMRIPEKVREKFVSNIRAEDQAGKNIELHFPECNLVVVVCDGSLASSLKHSHLQTLMSTVGCNEYKYTETAVVITEDKSFSGKSKSSKKCLERGGESYYKNYNSLKKISKKNKVGEILDLLGDDRLDFYHVLCMIMPTLSDKAKLKNSNEQTTFFRKINECCGNALRASDKFGVTNLSLPVLCSDYYDYSEGWFLRCCVSNMISEIKEFAKYRIQKQYMIIHIVTNGNDGVFKIFHEVMKAEQKRLERPV